MDLARPDLANLHSVITANFRLPIYDFLPMNPFAKHTGLVATLDRANVDTDQIIPKQFLKRIERSGFGKFLFFDWRFLEDGSANPEFELNREEAAGASILVARHNFGSGSSREHAVWALADHGFRALVAPSFADIFYNNCFKNGVLPVVLHEAVVEDIFRRAAEHTGYQLVVDLDECVVEDAHGLSIEFAVEPARRDRLLKGLDDIAMTMAHEHRIAGHEASRGMPPANAGP